jgi:hypothetical protein
MLDEALSRTVTIKLIVLGSDVDCQTLWQTLADEEIRRSLSRQFQRSIKELILDTGQVLQEDFNFRLEVSQNWHQSVVNTVSRDRNFFAAITRVNAQLRGDQPHLAERFIGQIEEATSDRDVWALIGRYTSYLASGDEGDLSAPD